MRRRHVARLGLGVAALLIAGCATSTPPSPSPAPSAPSEKAAPPQPVAVQPVPKKTDVDWNIFPDPITGRVEVYRNGEYVGSITGDEAEDPPMPHKVKGGLTE